jgi:imidazolonepropionase-like amidohydrolase
MKLNALALLFASFLAASAAGASTEKFTVIFGGKNVGHLKTSTDGDTTKVDFDFKNNGRGPTMAETVRLDGAGFPTHWTVKGTTTFGNKVDENFRLAGSKATWTDSTGKGSATIKQPSIYVAQSASPWSLGLYARALLKAPEGQLPALPAGTLRLEKGEAVSVRNASGATAEVNAYSVGGIDLQPDDVLLDGSGQMFAFLTPEFIIIRAGYEAEEERLRALAAKWSADRFVAIQKASAHRYESPVRIRNVRVFDPAKAALTEAVSVVVNGRTIAAVEPLDSPATSGEVTIDGAGGTLVPGMYEMHAHISQSDAFMNLLAGVTSVRDMGSDNEVLEKLVANIENGTLAGPRVIRSGFIEGKSPFSANNGFVVESEAQAVDAVRWYAARGYWQVKVYNSMNPAWVAAVVKEAHRLGLRVAGHVPAFATADQMIEAGYDEITHINQFMLGWVLKPGEDTRTLLRLHALKRLPELDLKSPAVQRTIDLMVAHKTAIDPTVAIHEALTQNRNGQVPPGAVDYLDHMPIGVQRNSKQALIDASVPADDKAYRGAFEQIVATVKMLNDRGVFIVPGTDLGGSFTYHRELELYQRAGMTPAQILKRATFDMAQYVGQDQQLGSIAKGKLADFFLIPGDPTADLKAIKTIRMVVKDGVVYFPSEIYPKFGIKPFVEAPSVLIPSPAAAGEG